MTDNIITKSLNSNSELKETIENFYQDPNIQYISFNAFYDGKSARLNITKNHRNNDKSFNFFDGKKGKRYYNLESFFNGAFLNISNNNIPYNIEVPPLSVPTQEQPQQKEQIEKTIQEVNKCNDITKLEYIKNIVENGGEVKFDTEDFKDAILKQTDTEFSFQGAGKSFDFSFIYNGGNRRRFNIKDLNSSDFNFNFSNISIKSISSIEPENLPQLKKDIPSPEKSYIRDILKNRGDVTITAKLINKKYDGLPNNVTINFKSIPGKYDKNRHDNDEYYFDIYSANKTRITSWNSIPNVDEVFQNLESFAELSDISIKSISNISQIQNLQPKTLTNLQHLINQSPAKVEEGLYATPFVQVDNKITNFAKTPKFDKDTKIKEISYTINSYIKEQETSRVKMDKKFNNNTDLNAKVYFCEKLFNNSLSVLDITNPQEKSEFFKLVFSDLKENNAVANATKERISKSMENEKSSPNLVKKYGCF